jgi:4-methyl-5(b-hydroxyethyl)-thiazole monophosphate biosynthesis
MPGSERLRDSKTLQQITKKQAESSQPYAAICAAPVVALQSWGLLKGLHATCHPSFADQLESAETAGSRVVKDNGLTTSQGPGSAFEFALSLTQQLYDHEKLALVRGPMVCDYYLLSIDLIVLSCNKLHYSCRVISQFCSG